MIRVKICGITREDDARAAADAGADAIGLVFWPRSPRCVSMAQAARIVEVLPPFVTTVGVFVDQPAPDIAMIVRSLGLGAAQLHGDEPREIWAGLPCRVFKAVAVDASFDPGSLASWPPGVVPLLDAGDREKRGGTGERVDWTVAARAARVRPIVLAGGLTAETVGDAIRVVDPAAVDVSSGVEDAPGVKNRERMTQFVRAVRECSQSRTP